MKNKEQKIKYFSCQEGLDSVSNRQNFSWSQQTKCSSKSMIRKHVLSGVLAFFVCFAIFAAVVFPLEQTSQISSPLSTIAATGPNNTDGWWTDDGRRGDSFAGGTGTQDDPYLIETAEQLAYLSYLIYSGTTDPQYSQYISGNYYFTGAYFKQTANIDLSDYYWQPIGIYYNRGGTRIQNAFSGYYDGGDFSISGLFTSADDYGEGVGLFGYVELQNIDFLPTIKNVHIENAFIQGVNYVGGIVGQCFTRMNITNCSFSGTISATGDYVAGIIGQIDGAYGGQDDQYVMSTISECENLGDITGIDYVAGIIGDYRAVNIISCYNNAPVQGENYVAGIAGNSSGDNGKAGVYKFCYNNGNITGISYVGGIFGRGDGDNCYNTGTVTGSSNYVGGIAGSGSCVNCYNTGAVTGANGVGGVSGSSTSTACFNVGSVTGTGTSVGGVSGQSATNSYYGGNCTEFSNTSRGIYSETLTTDAQNESWFSDSTIWAENTWDFALVWQIPQGSGYPVFIDDVMGDWWLNPNYYDAAWEGSGTAQDPYLIQDAADLAGLSYMVYSGDGDLSNYNCYYSGVYFKQTANIDLSAHYWQPIGSSFDSSTQHNFSGIYDGGNYYVSGIKFSTAASNQGLFSYVYGTSSTNLAEIKNLGIVNSTIQGYRNVGGVVAYSFYINISNCYNSATINAAGQRAGGIAGYVYGSISNCYNTGSITSTGTQVGGIVGYGENISDSYNTGVVIGDSEVGGISGALYGTIINCYNKGAVTGNISVGGLSGGSSGAVTILNSYNIGDVTRPEEATGYINGLGGIIGTATSNSIILNNYYGGACENIGAVNGEDTAGASYSATLATDAKDANWYRSSMPWDLNNVWQLDAGQNDGYPTLRMTSTSTDYWIDDGIRGTGFAGGSGTKSDPYKIETAAQLAYLSYMVYSGEGPHTNAFAREYYYSGDYFKQTDDIDLSGYYWQPIGIEYDRNGVYTQHYFSGSYDGGGYTVSGITTPIGTGNAYSDQGLFGSITHGSLTSLPTISNVKVADSLIQGYRNVGGIVGTINSSCVVKNSYSSATVIATEGYAGGIVGSGGDAVSNCYNAGLVMGQEYAGGICASGDPTDCYNMGSVIGDLRVGGICGYGDPVNCYNMGSVSGGSTVGGITGSGAPKSCFNIGAVQGTSSVGGVTGDGTATNCYYGGGCTASASANGAVYSISITDDARTQNWLTSTMGWDTYFVWKVDSDQNDGYPVFIKDLSDANVWISEGRYKTGWKGDGSQANPFQISSAEELAGLSYRLYSGTGEHSGNYYYANKHFVLTTDINLSAHAWVPIGNSTAYFSGIFDGAGHKITGVVGSSSYDYFALFSHIVGQDNRAGIKNLTVTNSVIDAATGTAGIFIIGENISVSNCTSYATISAIGDGALMNTIAAGIGLSVYNGVIEDCENLSTLNSGTMGFAAGIVGFASDVQITGCTNRASFSGMYSGGIMAGPVAMLFEIGFSDLTLNPSNSGYHLSATITDCTNYGNLSGAGIAGIAAVAGEVLRCVNYGNIEGSSIAGIVATNVNVVTSSAFSTTNIQYCVNYGTLTGYELGGIASQLALQNGTFANCTNYGEIVATSSGAGGVVYQVGAATNTTLSNLANYGAISGSVQRIGGLIARISGSSNITITLEDCVNANAISITGQGNSAGGLVGETNNSGWTLSFENCVNTGNITAANSTIGGIIGSVTVPVTMTSVFSLGNIDGSTYHVNIGGLIGASTASTITITSSVFEGDISSQLTSSSLYFGGFIGNATGCSNLSITGSYVNTDITVASTNAYASGMIGSITMSDTSSPAAIDKCAVVANISTSAEGEMTNSREFYFSPNLVDSATILNSYALFNNTLTISDTTTGMDGYFAYLDNFQNGLPIPIGLYYITSYGTTTGIADQLQKFVG